MEIKLKKGEYLLLKSCDDFTFEHCKDSPLTEKTGFFGTAGEAIVDEAGKATLFVDPRYHIQADNETKDKNVEVIKLDMETNFMKALKKRFKKGTTLYVPSSSTKLITAKKLDFLNVKTYKTQTTSVKSENIFEIPFNTSGKTSDEKFKNLFKKLKSAKLKGENYLITNMDDISYLTNLRCYDSPNCASVRGKMLILKDKIILFCDSKLPKLSNIIQIQPLKDFENVINNIKEPILINENSISLYDYALVQNPVVIRQNPVQIMQSIKTKAEISHLKDCFKRLDEAIFVFKRQIKPGLSELQLKEIFECELIKHGAYCTSFKTILSIADNTSSIHYSSYDKDKILKNGDLILLDCGGYYEGGLATDITRVFLCTETTPAKTKPTSLKTDNTFARADSTEATTTQKEIYTAVLKAQLNAYYKDFSTGDEMDIAARKILSPYKKQGFLFPHALGHGIGISVHQSPPVISSNLDKKQILKNNMVFSIEPGLYKEGEFGIRLENSVYFNKKINNGKKVSLSRFPYEENLIDRNKLTRQEIKWLDEWQNYDRN